MAYRVTNDCSYLDRRHIDHRKKGESFFFRLFFPFLPIPTWRTLMCTWNIFRILFARYLTELIFWVAKICLQNVAKMKRETWTILGFWMKEFKHRWQKMNNTCFYHENVQRLCIITFKSCFYQNFIWADVKILFWRKKCRQLKLKKEKT